MRSCAVRFIRCAGMLGLITLSAACYDSLTTAVRDSRQVAYVDASGAPQHTVRYLPVGTTVPPGDSIAALPDPSDDRPPLPNPMPEANLAARLGDVSPHRTPPIVRRIQAVNKRVLTTFGASTYDTCDPNAIICDCDPGSPNCDGGGGTIVVDSTDSDYPPGTGDQGFYLYQRSHIWYGIAAVFDFMTVDLPAPTGVPLQSPGCTPTMSSISTPAAALDRRGFSTVPSASRSMSDGPITAGSSPPPPTCYYPARVVYAPTMISPGGSCLEVTQANVRFTPFSGTQHFLGVYDWCTQPARLFVVRQPLDASFRNRYVRSYKGRLTYSVRQMTATRPDFTVTSTVGGCWTVNLYDYLQGYWVQLGTTVCGQPFHGLGTTGWTLWESYNVADGSIPCPSIPSVRSTDITLFMPRPLFEAPTPQPFTNYSSDFSSRGATGACWTSLRYTFAWPAPNDALNSWQAATPVFNANAF